MTKSKNDSEKHKNAQSKKSNESSNNEIRSGPEPGHQPINILSPQTVDIPLSSSMSISTGEISSQRDPSIVRSPPMFPCWIPVHTPPRSLRYRSRSYSSRTRMRSWRHTPR